MPPLRKSWLQRFLDSAERTGNRLPHPVTLFALAAVSVLILSWVSSQLGLQAVHPSTGKTVAPVNLLSGDGVRRVVTSLVTNFTGFAPLGTVLVAMLGVGAADGSGLLGVALRGIVLAAPRKLITLVVVFTGILSNAASEAGYVILVPLAGALFLAAGRHPLAGMAAAFAGVSGGYSANLVLGTIDPLLAGITTEAAHIVDPGYTVNPAANYYFMVASTFLLAAVGTVVTHKVVEPRLGSYSGQAPAVEPLKSNEKRGLKWAILAPVFVPMFMLLGFSPELTQGAYRVGDSVTNIVTPMMSYFALIMAFFQRYKPEAGVGTLIATMLPYTVAFLLCWLLLLVVWVLLGLPLGPGAELFLNTR